MAQQGVETGAFGEWLTEHLRSASKYQDFKVFYDHGDKTKYSNVLATKAFYGNTVSNTNRLADLDVVVIGPNGVADLILEIEERPSSPKKILGDVLALMLCNRLAAKIGGEQHYFELSHTTTLVVAGIAPGKGQRLKKIEKVIEPRLQDLDAPADSIDPKNIRLLFDEDIESVLASLRELVIERFPNTP